MAGESYQEHIVHPRLGEHVQCYWSSTVAPRGCGAHAVLPDGCIDLLFDATVGRLEVVGTMTRAEWLTGCGPRRFLGVRFRPGGAAPILRERADLLTDTQVDAGAVLGIAGRQLLDRLLAAKGGRAELDVVESFLLGELPRARAVEPRIAWATAKLLLDPIARVERVAGGLKVSRQHLRRLFLEHTGLSPKRFARVARLQALVPMLAAGRPLSDAALEAGYSDQAHMTNEFRDLVGVSPTGYLAS